MFDSISPLEYRYLQSFEADNIRKFLSEEGFISYLARVEAQLVRAYQLENLCPLEIFERVEQASQEITAAEVYEEEKRIHHQMKALVNCMVRRVGQDASRWIHLGATSHDIICTADSLRYRDFVQQSLLPAMIDLEKGLISLARREKSTIQIGRTHGQHAVPITLGFALAEYVSRWGDRILYIQKCARQLKGKFSGAVGAYNAQSILLADPIAFEKKFLALLDMEPTEHSTQIVPPEATLDLLHGVISAFGVLANLADDMRHLQRSEIDEVAEFFSDSQVGSSTMPHKRNPISFENVKSLYKVYMPRMITYYLDQISEHQRDLTNSASSRFISEIFCGFYLATQRMYKALGKLGVNRPSLEKNLQQSREKIMAEPYYLILSKHGYFDAHELVRKCVQETKGGLSEIQKQLPGLQLTPEEVHLLSNPEHYIGLSIAKTDIICNRWQKEINEIEAHSCK